MARCILALYRSAVQPAMANLGRRLADTERRPGLVFIPTEDHFVGTEQMYAEVATTLGAKALTMKGFNHWWMFGEGTAIGGGRPHRALGCRGGERLAAPNRATQSTYRRTDTT